MYLIQPAGFNTRPSIRALTEKSTVNKYVHQWRLDTQNILGAPPTAFQNDTKAKVYKKKKKSLIYSIYAIYVINDTENVPIWHNLI